MDKAYKSNMREERDLTPYEPYYREDAFWEKLKAFGKKAGIKLVYGALLLYYVVKSPDTKATDRAKILGALGYFILPVDIIPDFIPFAGYADDLAAITWGLYCVAKSITPEVKAQAAAKLHEWFGDFDDADLALFFEPKEPRASKQPENPEDPEEQGE